MCDTIQQLDKKNDKAHEVLNKKIEHIKKNMATKDDMQKLEDKLEPKINTASTISKFQKFIIGALITLVIGLLGIGIWGVASIATSSKTAAEAQISTLKAQQKMNSTLDSISQRIKASNSVARVFKAKQIMDTLNQHWGLEKRFYSKEFLQWKQWTYDIWKKEIHPTMQLSKQNRAVIEDNRKRIEKLEKKVK